MRWFSCKRFCGNTVVWMLNNKIFFFCQPLTKGYEFEFRIYLPKRHDFAIYGIGEFDWTHPLSVAFKFKRSRAKVSIALFGWKIAVRLGQTVVDEYDAHRDIYFPYGELVDNEWKAYQDKAMTIPENYVEPQPEEYKEFYSLKYLKIYNEDYRNCPFGRVVEFALPFQHYLKLAFNKPFEYWEWLGFNVDIDFSKGLGILGKLTLFKFDFITELSKKGAKNV